MTQIVLSISDNSILPGLRNILSRLQGVECVKVIREKEVSKIKIKEDLVDFRHAIESAKEFKDGKTEFATWEELMNEL